MKTYLSTLPKINTSQGLSDHERLVLEVFTRITSSGKDELAKVNEKTKTYKNLDSFLTEINGLLYTMYNVISSTYFKHAQTQQQLFR